MIADPVAEQCAAALHVVDAALPPGTVLGAYLFGSAVAGGLRPDSDLDILAVIARRLSAGEKRALVDGLLPISGRRTRPSGWRPIELTLVVQDEVRPWRYPPRFDLQYGEWLRATLEAGHLGSPRAFSPDVAILLTMVRADGRVLAGASASDLLDRVPPADVVRAIREEVAPLLEDLETDTRNVLLTLARMWTTVATGEVLSKDAAAKWALPRLPEEHRAVVAEARAGYIGEDESSWDGRLEAVRASADYMVGQVNTGR